MNTLIQGTAVAVAAFLLTACGGSAGELSDTASPDTLQPSTSPAENTAVPISLDERSVLAAQAAAEKKPEPLSYDGLATPAALSEQNKDAAAQAALSALAFRAQDLDLSSLKAGLSKLPSGGLLPKSSAQFDSLTEVMKTVGDSVAKLPLDVKGVPKQLSQDVSKDLCESGVATVLGSTAIDQKNAKGQANLDLTFDHCVTKTDGNTLTGTIGLVVKMGLLNADIGLELKELLISKEGKDGKVNGNFNLNIDYKLAWLNLFKETITWHFTTLVDDLSLTSLGEMKIDEFQNVTFSTTFRDDQGVAFKLDNLKSTIFSQKMTGTLFLPEIGSLALNSDKVEFCPDGELLKKGNINLSDSLGNLLKITGSGNCDTLPIVVLIPKS